MGLLDIAISGINVSQEAINTTGHNISNAGTPGYSRQEVVGVTRNALFRGFGYIGQGAEISTVRRVQDQFLTNQLRSDTSTFFQLETYRGNIEQIDQLLADDATGLQSQLDDFFAAMQGAADNPADIPSREVLLGEAQGLVDRFSTINRYLEDLNNTLNGQITSDVAQINSLTAGIALLNEAIVSALGGAASEPPNDLLDERDELVRQLSELVEVDVIEVDDTYNVSLPNGQALVSVYDNFELDARPSEEDPNRYGVFYAGATIEFDITSSITGGSLGGRLSYREEALDTAINNVGLIAVAVVQELNAQHNLGIDLNGNFGGDLFLDYNDPRLTADRVYAYESNGLPNDNYFNVYFDDVSELTTSEYVLNVPGPGGARYEVIRKSDGEVVSEGALQADLPQEISFDGLRVVLEDGTFNEGDSFTIAPLRTTAEDMNLLLNDPEALALGYPIRAESSLGNLGTAQIDQGTMLSVDASSFTTAGELTPPLIIIFNSPTSYSIYDNSDPGNPQPLEPPMENLPYVPGDSNTIFTDDPGETIVSSWRAPLSYQPALGIGGPSAVPLSNNINPERITFFVTDPETGEETELPTISTEGGESAADIADALNDVEGVTAIAYTEVHVSNFTNSGTTYDPDNPFDVWVNGFNLTQILDPSTQTVYTDGYPEEVPDALDPNFLADRINAHIDLQALGISAESDGETLIIRDEQGDDILIEMRGDEPQPVIAGSPPVNPNDPAFVNAYIDPGDTFGVSTGETYDLTPIQGDTQGQLNNLTGYDFDENGPYVYEVQLPDGITGTLTITGDYDTADELKAEFQRQLDILVTDPGYTEVDISPTGELSYKVFTQMTGTGSDDVERLNIGGQVDVIMADGIRMETDPQIGGIFNGVPEAKSSYYGFQFDISGYAEAGDEFVIEWNEGGVSDNRNALDMVALQIKETIGGNASFSEAYTQLIVEIGVLTSQAQIQSDAAYAVLENTQNEIQSISGVNLDEEAARLIEFQAAYNANARVLSIAQELFDSLLAAF